MVEQGFDFHHFYLASLGLCILNILFVSAAFKWEKGGYPEEQEENLSQPQQPQQIGKNSQLTVQRPPVIRTGPDDEIKLEVLPATINENDYPSRLINVVESQKRIPTKHFINSTRDWSTLLRKGTYIFSVSCLFYVGTE